MPLLDTYTTPEGRTVDLYVFPAVPGDPRGEPALYAVDRRDPPDPDPASPNHPLGPITFSITGRNLPAMRDVFNLWR